jgi:hypothetical protein
MQILHRISIASTPEIRRELARMSIVVGASGLVTFEVDEDHESWPALQSWISRRDALDFIYTNFSAKEVAASRWLALKPDWHHGYPQPDEGHFGYRKATYSVSDFCQPCGIGLKQDAPFQMKSEPRWGRRGILQLNWIFDEFFVTPEIGSAVFRPHGIGSRPVLDKKGSVLKTVVQLVVEEEVGLEVEGLASERCASCGRIKFLPVVRGPIPPLVNEPSSRMAKTREYFGSGGAADRKVLVSQEVARTMMAAKLRGAFLHPVAEPPKENGPSRPPEGAAL